MYGTAEHRSEGVGLSTGRRNAEPLCPENETSIVRMPGTGRPGMEVPGKSAERSLAGELAHLDNRNRIMPSSVTPEEPDLHLISRYQYQYDAQGNVTGDGENRYRYDSRNRLTEIETKAGGVQRNRYDGEGLRAELEENGELTRFLFSGREVVAEETEEHTVIRYIRGLELLSSDCESARTYYHYACDEFGSVTHVTDEAGAVLNRYTYDAFGNRTSAEETVENRFGFTGELLDGLTGQYYLRARFYSPAIGRFLQEDTYYGDGLNLYSYCQNNPVKYVDPSGHNGCPKEGLMEKYKAQGMLDADAERMANYEILRNTKGVDVAEEYLRNERKILDAGSGANSTKYVSWMNEWAYNEFYGSKDNALLGAPNGAVWVMKDTDAAMCTSIGAVARDTGMAGGVKNAYLNGEPYVYGIAIDSNSVNVSKPTKSISGVNADWNSNGRIAVNGDGFILDTGVEEFVIEGGKSMPSGSYSFRMDDYGNIEILKEW